MALLPKHVAAVIKYQKDPLRAFDMFNSVKKENGFKHNLLTYKSIVEKLGYHGEFNVMERVIEETRRNLDCPQMLEGVYITAMKSYGKKGKVQDAVNVFERMDFFECEPTVMSHNAIMNILVEHGYHNQAHKVYLRMKDRGINPDVYTFTIRIKSFCKTKRPHVALRLLRNMPGQGCLCNAVSYCTVVAGFYESEGTIEASELFDEMLMIGNTPDAPTFNKLIHVLSKMGDVRESERLLSKVLKRGTIPNLITFNIFIQCLCESGRLDDAARMLESVMGKGLSHDVVSCNTLIRGLCKNGEVVKAESILHNMVNSGFEPDAFTYNTIINGYSKRGMVQNAEKILNDATFRGFAPDHFTYCSLIYGFCEDGDLDRAMSVFNEATGKDIKPTAILYNSLIKGLSEHGLILEALQLMKEMPEKGCSPDIWTYNLIINGLCKMGCLSDANSMTSDAISKGFLPDIFTFNTLIDGYCKKYEMANALEIVNTMWEHGVSPDVITYNTVLNGLCKTSKSDDVGETFKAMVDKGCVPNIITYNIVMESLCKARKLPLALELLEDMQRNCLIPDVITFGTLINGFVANEDIHGAYKLFRTMKTKYKVSHTTATYGIMINAFAEKLNLDMAEKLFHEMGKNGCSPDAYTYRCMIEGFCRIGNTDSGYLFLLDEMKKGIVPSLSTVGRVINCLCFSNRLLEAVGIIHLMVKLGIVPDAVNTIFETDKRDVAAPKIVVEDLLKKNHITYYAYELLHDGIRNKKLSKKKPSNRSRSV